MIRVQLSCMVFQILRILKSRMVISRAFYRFENFQGIYPPSLNPHILFYCNGLTIWHAFLDITHIQTRRRIRRIYAPPQSHEAYVGLLYLMSPWPEVFWDIVITMFNNKNSSRSPSLNLTYSFISFIKCMYTKAIQIVWTEIYQPLRHWQIG